MVALAAMDNTLNPAPEGRDIWTVSRLNLETQGLLEGSFPLVWLEAEISNLSRPASGHLYFSLKDDRAQVSAAMFRGRNQRLRFTPGNGQQVLVRARVTLYVPRGSFQLVVEHMEEAGEGRLRREFERLKASLQAEGLFEQARKRPLPAMPRQIGVITSASGAALRDILQVLARRCPSIPVMIYPAAVQGSDAPAGLRRALATANQRAECDVLILGRGGGSLEDLWAFNDEQLARDVARSGIPVVSAVGHEVDFTLTDFVADLRAPTPSAAAELAGPDLASWRRRLVHAAQRLSHLAHTQLRQAGQRLDWLRKRLPHPLRQLDVQNQRLDELDGRMARQLANRIREDRQRLTHLQQRLTQARPQARLALASQRLNAQEQRFSRAMQLRLQQQQQTLARLGERLHMASPLQTLDRGYSVTLLENAAVRSISQVTPGSVLRTRVADGEIHSTVTAVNGMSGDRD